METTNANTIIADDHGVDNTKRTIPLILNFLTKVEGASSGTTSGTWSDVDASDKDS